MRICLTVAASCAWEALRVIKGCRGYDFVEVRLDYFQDFSKLDLLGEIKKPLIATCMPKWDGGRFEGEEDERISILLEAARYADYLTIELETQKGRREKLMSGVKPLGKRAIVAHHDFEATPSKEEIIGLLEQEFKAGADIAKVAFRANSREDVIRLLQAMLEAKEKFGKEVIAISMGKEGRISRFLFPLLGSYLTYAAPSMQLRVAEEQPTLKELLEFRKGLGQFL